MPGKGEGREEEEEEGEGRKVRTPHPSILPTSLIAVSVKNKRYATMFGGHLSNKYVRMNTLALHNRI